MIDLLIVPAIAVGVYYVGTKLLNWHESSLIKRYPMSFSAPSFIQPPFRDKDLRDVREFLTANPPSPSFRCK